MKGALHGDPSLPPEKGPVKREWRAVRAISKPPVEQVGCTGPKRTSCGFRSARDTEISGPHDPHRHRQTGRLGDYFLPSISTKIALLVMPFAPFPLGKPGAKVLWLPPGKGLPKLQPKTARHPGGLSMWEGERAALYSPSTDWRMKWRMRSLVSRNSSVRGKSASRLPLQRTGSSSPISPGAPVRM